MKVAVFALMFFLLVGCTTGQLEYITPEGETQYACATEYTWQPSVDKYAVEYILSHCAKEAAKRGNTIIDKKLLSLDLTVPKPPQGQTWNVELAKSMHKSGQLTDKQYGYLIAFIDLGLKQLPE